MCVCVYVCVCVSVCVLDGFHACSALTWSTLLSLGITTWCWDAASCFHSECFTLHPPNPLLKLVGQPPQHCPPSRRPELMLGKDLCLRHPGQLLLPHCLPGLSIPRAYLLSRATSFKFGMVLNYLPSQRRGSQEGGACGSQVSAWGSWFCLYLHKEQHGPKQLRKRKKQRETVE